MKEKKIQTRHPEKGKKNKLITVENYKVIKAAIFKVLYNSEPTYTELLQELTEDLRENFNKNLNWYAMTVKLDLEARKLIERTQTKPQRYRLTNTGRKQISIHDNETDNETLAI